jgi:hypothetical protein
MALSAQQKTVVYDQQIWGGYIINKRFNDKWGLYLDGELHTRDHLVNNFSQFTVRFAGAYYLKNNNRFLAGYGFSDSFLADADKSISVPEHFLWQQFQWYQNKPKHKLSQWIRLEEKWKETVLSDFTVTDDFANYYKLRYNINYQIPLSKMGFAAKTAALVMSEEIFLYYGPTLSNHVFDQNRAFVGLSYALNEHDNFVIGYLNIIQQNQAATILKNSSILKMTLFLNL